MVGGRAMVSFCACMYMVVLDSFRRVSLSGLYAWKLLLDQTGQVRRLPCGLLVSGCGKKRGLKRRRAR